MKSTRSSKPAADPYLAKVIGKAFRAFELIRGAPDPLTLTEVKARLGGAKSSVFRILHTLQAMGYIERDSRGAYQPAPELRSKERAPYLHRLVRMAEPRLRVLHREFEETTSLAALFQNHIEVVTVLESPHIIRMSNMAGRILPPHASSLGKSIAAFLPEDRREGLVRSYGIYRYTPRTLTDADDLSQEFARIRKSGYAMDREENAIGGICFGAPVFASAHDPVGAISVSAPKIRVDPTRRERILGEVRRAAREISSELEES